MLLIIDAPDVRDHLSDREVSTALFLPANIGSMVSCVTFYETGIPRFMRFFEKQLTMSI
jgi:spore coat protein CotF